MRILILTFVLITATSISFGERNIRAEIKNGWVIAGQGSDEDALEVKVKIWGHSRVQGGFDQLDEDLEQEYVVISRGIGTGPYYKLQIIDFKPNGILTWSYGSFGVPQIEKGIISLGNFPNNNESAVTKLDYSKYSLSADGLTKIEKK